MFSHESTFEPQNHQHQLKRRYLEAMMVSRIWEASFDLLPFSLSSQPWRRFTWNHLISSRSFLLWLLPIFLKLSLLSRALALSIYTMLFLALSFYLFISLFLTRSFSFILSFNWQVITLCAAIFLSFLCHILKLSLALSFFYTYVFIDSVFLTLTLFNCLPTLSFYCSDLLLIFLSSYPSSLYLSLFRKLFSFI